MLSPEHHGEERETDGLSVSIGLISDAAMETMAEGKDGRRVRCLGHWNGLLDGV
jgi:hypothetical protein